MSPLKKEDLLFVLNKDGTGRGQVEFYKKKFYFTSSKKPEKGKYMPKIVLDREKAVYLCQNLTWMKETFDKTYKEMKEKEEESGESSEDDFDESKRPRLNDSASDDENKEHNKSNKTINEIVLLENKKDNVKITLCLKIWENRLFLSMTRFYRKGKSKWFPSSGGIQFNNVDIHNFTAFVDKCVAKSG